LKSPIITLLARDLTALVGAFDLNAPNEIGLTAIAIKKTYVHPDWNQHLATFDADIAILELSRIVFYDNYVYPICMIHPEHDKNNISSTNFGIIAGYGFDENMNYGTIPKMMTTPIFNRDECFERSSSHETMISARTICGGYANGTGTCTGDSGSGVIVSYNETFYLRGIVSSSLINELGACNVYNHSVYTNVVKFHSWIEDISDEIENST